MVTYTVHEREDEAGDISSRADKIVFVRWGFAWLALVIPVLWLLYHRLWIVIAGFIALIFLIQVGFMALGSDQEAAGWALLIANSAFALFANDLRRWTLSLRGYRMVEMVSGKNIVECERRFFTIWLAEQEALEDEDLRAGPGSHQIITAPIPASRSSMESDGVIGLFPETGK